MINLNKIGDNPLYVLHDDVFKGWFAITTEGIVDPENPDNKANAACIIEEYQLVDADGAPLVSDVVKLSKHYNDYIKQDILVSLEN